MTVLCETAAKIELSAAGKKIRGYDFGKFEDPNGKDMEDRIVTEYCDNVLFLAVYDGHGGTALKAHKQVVRCVDYVSDNLTQSVCSIVQSSSSDASLRREVQEAFRVLDLETFTDGSGIQNGTTACCVVVNEGRLTIINLGDSQAVLGRKGGKYKCLSSVHRPGEKSENQRLLKEGVEVAEERHGDVIEHRLPCSLAVSRSFGDFFNREALPNERSRSLPQYMGGRPGVPPSHCQQRVLRPSESLESLREDKESLLDDDTLKSSTPRVHSFRSQPTIDASTSPPTRTTRGRNFDSTDPSEGEDCGSAAANLVCEDIQSRLQKADTDPGPGSKLESQKPSPKGRRSCGERLCEFTGCSKANHVRRTRRMQKEHRLGHVWNTKPPGLSFLPEVLHHEIDEEQDCFLIIACDGIFDCMPDMKMPVQIVRNVLADRCKTAEDAAKELVRVSKKQGPLSGVMDNLSAIVLVFKREEVQQKYQNSALAKMKAARAAKLAAELGGGNVASG